ncbi:Alpha/Beta hydrolase protein [Xylariomycetidae sp. FL2044]|nr:Alpha/Beta hydrolase protein [Xylariomycetidae sp. FL2044]
MAKDTSPDTDTLHITRRSDLSVFYKVLRTIIRPFRPRLVSSSKHYPAGSPRLPLRPRKIQRVTITERRLDIEPGGSVSTDPNADAETGSDPLWVYDFEAPNRPPPPPSSGDEDGASKPPHTVYYFAGGGFQAPPTTGHWKFCAHLASALAPSRGRVVLVSYPLAPNSPAHLSLPLLRRWLRRALADAAATGGVVSLMGDSAGANVALSLGLWCADERAAAGASRRGRGRREGEDKTQAGAGSREEEEEEEDSLARLRSVVAICPPTDMRNQHPAIAQADAQDPVLDKSVTDGAAEAWSKGSDKEDPYLSPNLADLERVRECGLRIHGVVGTADLLAPDALVFVDRCKEAGVRGEWLIWEGQMHCFPLASCYGVREGIEGRTWMEELLRGVS